jgi:hypothetical protein
MLKFDNLTSAQDLVRHANSEHDRLLVQLLETMTSRIVQLEAQVNEFGQWRANADTTGARLDRLEARLDQFDCNDQAPFNDRVLEVLEVRSGTARVALGLDDADIERRVLGTIEDNSYSVFAHIEAELEEKIDTFSQSYSFSEAVAEAVKGSVAEVVEEIIEDRISTDFLDADATDVVRKGLRSLL